MRNRLKTAAQPLKDYCTQRQKTIWYQPIVFSLCSLFLVLYSTLLTSCNPEAKWETENVEVSMDIKTISAGFIEASFSTNKDAYYLIAIQEPWENFDPMTNQKAFMQLALDSAYADYLKWRNEHYRNQETVVAPFSSHSLQYGAINHFFTGLWGNHDYWLYSFAVNPQTMTPVGKLNLVKINTEPKSIVNIRFDYRVRGAWDYIYPIDSLENINTRFPYLAMTIDSVELADSIAKSLLLYNPCHYFHLWQLKSYLIPYQQPVKYGVHAVENKYGQSSCDFEEGHTYYTAIAGYDFEISQLAVYKFTWNQNLTFYFHDTDTTNRYRMYENGTSDGW